MKKEHLLLIDIQNDFCDKAGALFVPGSIENNRNLVYFVEQKMEHWHQIFLTMDSHWAYDIAHPNFWQTADGKALQPFTFVSQAMLAHGDCKVSNAHDEKKALAYLSALEKKSMPHTIWPEHCLVGSWGHLLTDEMYEIITNFQHIHKKAPQLVWKGLNPYSEHFSAFSALVPDPSDATTLFQHAFANNLLDCDVLYVAGQALSHCVGESLVDLYNHCNNKELFKKIVLLLDCTSAVPGFEELAEKYLSQFREWGMILTTTKECEISK